jgi:GDP-L-fucose synthase
MKALIFGGSGYIGQNIIKARPDWAWTSISTKDLDLSKDGAENLISGNYDIVINAAGFYGGLVFNRTYGHDILYKNIAIANNVFKILQKIKPKRFIQVGSACIYPQQSCNLISEDLVGIGNYHPSTIYSSMAKQYQLDVLKTLDLAWEYLILTNVYGPGEPIDFEKSHFVGSLLNKIKNSTDVLTMIGTGAAVRDFMYIDDAVEAICQMAELHTATNSPTNISSGQGHSIREITEISVKNSQKSLEITWGDSRDDGLLHKVLNNSKMSKLINFSPKTPIDQGLLQTWDCINESKRIYS